MWHASYVDFVFHETLFLFICKPVITEANFVQKRGCSERSLRKCNQTVITRFKCRPKQLCRAVPKTSRSAFSRLHRPWKQPARSALCTWINWDHLNAFYKNGVNLWTGIFACPVKSHSQGDASDLLIRIIEMTSNRINNMYPFCFCLIICTMKENQAYSQLTGHYIFLQLEFKD